MAEPLTPATLRSQAAALLRRRQAEAQARAGVDIADWAEANYYVVDEVSRQPRLIELHAVQTAVLRALTAGHYSTAILSTVKKSGKTTLAGIVARFVAEMRSRFGEIYCIGNDFEQARDRSFKSVADSIKLDPYVRQRAGEWILPGSWLCQKTQLHCLATQSFIRAIAVDARGEAGSNPDLSIWTELWGFDRDDAIKMWNEMTPVPTKPASMRLVETYAGWEGESELLYNLYQLGLAGRQLQNHELASLAAREAKTDFRLQSETANDDSKVPLPSAYETFLHAFEETGGDPEAPVPVWVNEAAGLFMYWDAGEEARRMPWQRGAAGERYYREQEAVLTPPNFARYHRNEWAGAEGEFVPLTAWDACQEELPPYLPADKTPTVLAVDAATTGDCFGIVAVTRHPAAERHGHVAVRATRLWNPAEAGGRVDYAEADAFIRLAAQLYNIICVVYDPYQLEALSQRWRKDGVAWIEPFPQGGQRLEADRQLYDMIINRELAHGGDSALREHIGNCRAKFQAAEDSKLRIVKKSASRKIDLAVALSMGAYQCRYLLL